MNKQMNRVFNVKNFFYSKAVSNFENLICLISSIFFLSYYFAIPIFNTGKEQILFNIEVVLSSFFTIIFLPSITRQLKIIPKKLYFQNQNLKEVPLIFILISFISFSIYFSFFSWDGSNNIFHSASAFLRIIWLFYATQINTNTSRRYIYLFLIMTLIMGFIDNQRTYLLMYLFIIFFQLRLSILPSLILLFIIFITLTLIATTRNNQPFDVFQSVAYAFGGETYLATLSYVEAYKYINFNLTDNLYHLFYLFFSPIIVLLNKILSIIPFDLGSDFIFKDLFQVRFGEFNIMGGHFISSTFLSFKSLQWLIQPIYLIYTYSLTKILIGPLSIPLSSILFILSLKNTPSVYWNLVMIILVFGFLFKFIRRNKLI